MVRTAAEMAQLLPAPAQKDALEWGPYSGVEEQFQKILTNEISIESIIGSDSQVPALTDNFPVNEYFFLRKIFAKPFSKEIAISQLGESVPH